MNEYKYPKKSGRYEWQTQKQWERLVDILRNIQHGEYKLLPTWMVEPLAYALIENGVTLPTFKIGDIVWIYDFMWGVIPCKVDGPYHCHAGSDSGCTFKMSFSEADIGISVFATKEDAEYYWRHGGSYESRTDTL